MDDKRIKAEAMIYSVMDLMDPSGKNTERYKRFFQNMTDSQFNSWMDEFLKNPKKQFELQALPFEEPKYDNIEAAANYLDVPIEEYIYFRDGEYEKDHPIKSRSKCITGWLHIKREQQLLSKKNRYTFDAEDRDMKTGQVTGESKVAALSAPEVNSLIAMGANKALEEFLGPRADNMGKKNQMYNDIARDGYVKLSELEGSLDDSVTLNTVDTYLIAAGLKSDLITDGLKTSYTVKEELAGKKK